MLTGQAKPTENRRPTFEVTAVDNLQRISFLSINFIYLVTLLKNVPSEKQTRLKLDRKTWIFPDFKVRPLCRLYIRIFFFCIDLHISWKKQLYWVFIDYHLSVLEKNCPTTHHYKAHSAAEICRWFFLAGLLL